MPIHVLDNAPTLLIHRSAFERAGLTRSAIDEHYNLTPDEFHVEGDLVAVGPLYDDNALGALVQQLEELGLVYWDDFFELSGNWPTWCRVYVRSD